jgi:hypothetical protein
MRTILAFGLLVPRLALACDGHDGNTWDASATTPTSTQPATVAIDPAHCAKMASLVGSNCSFSTGMMAQRVLDEGTPYSYAGTLTPSSNHLGSHVAAPYAIGPDGAINLVANEVIEQLTAGGNANGRVVLDGKVLEVDGVKYFVATAFHNLNS